MNASEIRHIEEQLTVSRFRLPVSQEYIDDVVRRAKRERALVIGKMLASIPERLFRLVRGVRRTAAACTAARMRHI